jgi:uncharacterized membrane protein YraQ (UPF0718 family)
VTATLLLAALFLGLLVVALRRSRATFLDGIERAMEQLAHVLPQLVVVLLVAGFLAKLIPSEIVGGLIGPESGWMGLVIAACAGPFVPGGPILAFSIAALFERMGATPEALVAFITSWSLFTLHRMVGYELPLLGASFLRLRLLSVGFVPIAAGVIAAGLVRWLDL